MALTEAEINKRVSESYEVENNVLEAVPNPLVSIRTSTYNHGSYIKQCIEGILMQKTNFAFEYIIGEDFSTDETREIVFDYAKKYPNIIRVITADYNVGSKANGRRCINACRGKYMAICEGDDYWTDPLKLQKQVDYLESHPEYVMSHTSFKYYYERDRRYYAAHDIQKNIQNLSDNPELVLFNKYHVQTLTVLIRRDILDLVSTADPFLFRSGYFMMGDTQLWYSMAKEGKVHFLPEVTAVYRKNDSSLTRSKNLKSLFRFRLSSMELRMYLCKRDNLSVEFHDYVTKQYDKALIQYQCFDKSFTPRFPINNISNIRMLRLLYYVGILNFLLSVKAFGYRLFGPIKRYLFKR